MVVLPLPGNEREREDGVVMAREMNQKYGKNNGRKK